MAIFEGEDLSALIDNPNTPEVRRHFHAVDISESIWNRIQELDINQTQLAAMLGKSCSQVSRMISAQSNMTLQTISELEHVLGITLADTTPYKAPEVSRTIPAPTYHENSWSRAYKSNFSSNKPLLEKEWSYVA